MKTTKLQWKKCPSTSRENRFFYTAKTDDTAYWVSQNWKTHKWNVEDSHGAVWGEFKTAKQGMAAVAKHVQPPKPRPAAAVEWPFSQARYDLMVEKAKEFVIIRDGDMGFVDPQTNLIALQAMLLGWLYCQEWWQKYENDCATAFPRDNPYLTGDDKCLEAVSDATRKLIAYP